MNALGGETVAFRDEVAFPFLADVSDYPGADISWTSFGGVPLYTVIPEGAAATALVDVDPVADALQVGLVQVLVVPAPLSVDFPPGAPVDGIVRLEFLSGRAAYMSTRALGRVPYPFIPDPIHDFQPDYVPSPLLLYSDALDAAAGGAALTDLTLIEVRHPTIPWTVWKVNDFEVSR